MIAAVVVTYSAPAAVLDRCVRALVDAGGLDLVVVVDTGGGATIADDLGVDGGLGIELVRMANAGYGAAANLGFRHAAAAGADRFALLNDDVVVRPGWLDPLIDELDRDDRNGVVQPALVDASGDRVVSLGVELDRYGAGHDIGDGAGLPDPASPRDLDLFTGGAIVVRDAFLAATGGFDERLFLYYEDVDLARHGASLGWRYRLVPASVVQHDRGMSTSQLVELTRYHQERNRLWIALRYASPRAVAAALWLSCRRLRHPPRRVHARALAAGIAGVRWRRRRATGFPSQAL